MSWRDAWGQPRSSIAVTHKGTIERNIYTYPLPFYDSPFMSTCNMEHILKLLPIRYNFARPIAYSWELLETKTCILFFLG